MQIDRKYKIEKAVSTDTLRENLQNVFVSKRHAVATDGKILAIVPVQTDKEDEAGWLTPDALKHARKVSGKGLDSVRIGLNGAQILPDGTVMTRPEEHKPPQDFPASSACAPRPLLPNWRECGISERPGGCSRVRRTRA